MNVTVETTAIDPDVERSSWSGRTTASIAKADRPAVFRRLLPRDLDRVAVPSESYTDIELVNIAPMAASAGRFAAIVVEAVALPLVAAMLCRSARGCRCWRFRQPHPRRPYASEQIGAIIDEIAAAVDREGAIPRIERGAAVSDVVTGKNPLPEWRCRLNWSSSSAALVWKCSIVRCS